MKLRYTIVLLLLFLGLPDPTSAQVKSRYCMTVRDEMGATIPKAAIKFNPTKQSRSQIKYKFIGDPDGEIEVVVIDGIYDIEIKAETFHKVVLKKQLLPFDPRSCITISLKTKIPPHQIT